MENVEEFTFEVGRVWSIPDCYQQGEPEYYEQTHFWKCLKTKSYLWMNLIWDLLFLQIFHIVELSDCVFHESETKK